MNNSLYTPGTCYILWSVSASVRLLFTYQLQFTPTLADRDNVSGRPDRYEFQARARTVRRGPIPVPWGIPFIKFWRLTWLPLSEYKLMN